MKFSDVFEFQNKSGIKAGEGLGQGRYFFYTSSDERTKFLNEYLFDDDALIFGTGGNASVHFTDQKFAVSTDCLIAQPRDKKKVCAKFYYYFLRGNMRILEGGFKGAGLKHISKSYISAIELPDDDYQQQKQVIDVLDRVEVLRKKRKQSLWLLDEFLLSTFLDMFGDSKKHKWPEVLISDIAEKRKGSMRTGPFGSALLHSEFVDKGIAVLGIDNAVENRFSWKERRYITPEKYKLLQQYTVYPGDVIITIMGTLGRSAVVPEDIPVAINTKHLACITLDKNIANSQFISYSIYSDPFILRQLKSNKRGAIMDGLNLSIIKNLKTYLPPIDLQNKFVGIINKTQDIKEKMLLGFEEIDNQFNALIQKYFS